MRAIRRIAKFSAINDFEYFVTLSFNKELSDKYGFGIVDKTLRWMSDRFRRKGIRTKYIAVVVPKGDKWHMHLLLGEVPEGEFSNMSQCPEQQTLEAKENLRKGAVLFCWPAFYKRFGSLSYIQQFGTRDENFEIVYQDGKSKYIERQFLTRETEEDDKILDQRLQLYRDFIPNGKQPYRHSRNLNKPEKKFGGAVWREEMDGFLTACGLRSGPMGLSATVDTATGAEFLSLLEDYRLRH